MGSSHSSDGRGMASLRKSCAASVWKGNQYQKLIRDNSPLELLSVALRTMRPKIIGRAWVPNRQSPNEAVFQFELLRINTSHFAEAGQQSNKPVVTDDFFSNGYNVCGKCSFLEFMWLILLFQWTDFPDIQVIYHVCYPDTFDEYELKFLGNKG